MTHKNYILHLILLFIFTFVSCSKEANDALLSKLADIQEQGDTCPQKAILRLDSIKPLFEEESEYMRNKLLLLDIRLHDKAYITHTSDSVIKQVCSYFEEYGSVKEMQEAYYYMGSVYRDLKDSPRAVTYYLKAIEMAEKDEDSDPAIFEVSCLQLAGLYGKQCNYTEALNVKLKGLEVAEKYGLANERTYMEVANAYCDIKDMPNCMLFCNRSMSIIKKSGINKENADLVSRAMSLYARTGNNEDAELCFRMLRQLKKSERLHNYLASLSTFYEKCVSVDSAAVIIHEIFDTTGNIKELYDSSRKLTIYYTNKGDYENATKYAVYFIRANNTINKERDTENTDKAKNIYQYQRDKEEELKIIEMLPIADFS